MKFWFPALALVATVSLPALAQEAPPPDAPRPDGRAAMARPTTQQMEAMQKLHEQMRQIRRQSRLQMLGSLTPAHRAAIANIIGQLAIAPQPNRRAAEAQIDALLSPAEKNAVVGAEATARANSISLMEGARAQFEASLPADERAKLQAREAARAARQSQSHPQMTPDAGRVLLRVAEAGEGRPGEGGRMGERGMGERGMGEHGMGEFMRGPAPGGASN